MRLARSRSLAGPLAIGLSFATVTPASTDPQITGPTDQRCWERYQEARIYATELDELLHPDEHGRQSPNPGQLEQLKARLKGLRDVVEGCRRKQSSAAASCAQEWETDFAGAFVRMIDESAAAEAAGGSSWAKAAERFRAELEDLTNRRDKCETGQGDDAGSGMWSWLAVATGGAIAAVVLARQDEQEPCTAPALPSRVSMNASKVSDTCGQGAHPDQISNPGVGVTFDGASLTVHSASDVTGPVHIDCSTAAWTGQGVFDGIPGTGTETYSGRWIFENDRWVFRGTLTFEFADCVATYDVELIGQS